MSNADSATAGPGNDHDKNDTRSSSDLNTLGDEEEYPVDHKTDQRFVRGEYIASGSTSYVEHVEEKTTGRCFARKQFIILRGQHRESVFKVFANEVKTIQRLKDHVHFVRVYAAYAKDKNFSLVLEPKASDGDLAMFLDVYLQGNISDARMDSMTSTLDQAFGCLISGLAFMHERKIRHKDVKPGNILLHQGTVYWADFGYAKESVLSEQSLTAGGIDGGITNKYAAFEVLSRGERNSKADIFSLACVYMEIYFAIVFKQRVPESQTIYAHKMGRLCGLLAKGTTSDDILNEVPPRINQVTRIIGEMGLINPVERPDANTVCLQILVPEHIGFGCTECRAQFTKHKRYQEVLHQPSDSTMGAETSTSVASPTFPTAQQMSGIKEQSTTPVFRPRTSLGPEPPRLPAGPSLDTPTLESVVLEVQRKATTSSERVHHNSDNNNKDTSQCSERKALGVDTPNSRVTPAKITIYKDLILRKLINMDRNTLRNDI
jgi:serine/threonine protein kinase